MTTQKIANWMETVANAIPASMLVAFPFQVLESATYSQLNWAGRYRQALLLVLAARGKSVLGRKRGRGRDAGCPAPPAQIRT